METKKICLFGDSISKGVIIDTVSNRYAMTKENFANILSSWEGWLDIKNHSMLGCTISKGRSLITRHIKDLEACDFAVLEYGGNDSDHNWAEISARPNGVHFPKTTIEDFARNYREIIEGIFRMGKQLIILNLPPIDEHKYFSWICRGLDSSIILNWLGGSERQIFDFHDGYNTCVCEVAQESSIPIIDIRSAFLNLGNYSDFLCDDGIHPNEKGHKLIAATIKNALPQLIASLSRKQHTTPEGLNSPLFSS